MPFARDAGPGVHSAIYAVRISTFQSINASACWKFTNAEMFAKFDSLAV